MADMSAVARSGARIHLSHPRIDLIDAKDIAEQLSKQPMYRGATWGFYSVAQHSVLVAAELARAEGPLAALYALLHHAHAVYTSDVAQAFSEAVRLLAAIHGAFDLDWPAPETIAAAHALAHASVEMTELRQLTAGREADVEVFELAGTQPLRRMIRPLGWERAAFAFAESMQLNCVAAQLGRVPAMKGLL